jgi:hypothetical protein
MGVPYGAYSYHQQLDRLQIDNYHADFDRVSNDRGPLVIDTAPTAAPLPLPLPLPFSTVVKVWMAACGASGVVVGWLLAQL